MLKYLFALVVSAGVIAGGMYFYQRRNQLFRTDFDRTGGTLVVFEIDGDPPAGGLDALVEALRNRFDPTGSAGFSIRADGERRVAIGVPEGKHHNDLIETVKRVAARPGQLRFRMLANAMDDEPAWTVASAPVPKAKLDAPPPPRDSRGSDEFPLKVAGLPPHHYRWLPSSEGHVKAMYLDPASLKRENPGDAPNVENSYRTGQAFTSRMYGTTDQALWQARILPGKTDPSFFLLVREPLAGQEIRVEKLEHVRASGMRGMYTVQFRINQNRRARFNEMLNKSASMPGGGMDNRLVAIVMDGEIVATPNIYLLIGRDATLRSGLTKEDADDLVLLLQGGELPCRLKPKPVRETGVGKGAKPAGESEAKE